MYSELQESQYSHVPGSPAPVYDRFEHGPFSLEYLRFGQGEYPLICFHGYGRKAEDFAFLVPHLAPGVSLYSFNLFGHGRSRYPKERMERNTISKREWASIFRTFLDELGAEKAAILGYSIGGRASLCLLEEMPERLDGAYLFAPDGLQLFSWYRYLSRIPGVQKLFRRQIERPGLLFSCFALLYKSGAIDRKAHRFLLHHIRTKAQRKAVLEIWNMHRDLVPDLIEIREALKEDRFTLRTFFGKKDPVIPPKSSKMLVRGPKEDPTIHILDKGHLLLDNECIIYLKDPAHFDDPLHLFS